MRRSFNLIELGIQDVSFYPPQIKKVFLAACVAAFSGVNPASAAILNTPAGNSRMLDARVEPILMAQAVSCDSIRSVNFSARAASGGVNIRSAPSLNGSIIRKSRSDETLYFDGWRYGDRVNGLWSNQPDERWYKIQGQNAWVSSAVVWGNAPGSTSLCPSGSSSGNFYRNPEAFFKWANGQQKIARLDTGDYKGECVSLIARYLQEVFFSGNQRTQPLTLGNGRDVASNVGRNYSQYFQPATNQGLPKRGAVISFPSPKGNPVCPGGRQCGHVAIVMDAHFLNGQRQVKIMDSSNSRGGDVRELTWWINIPDGTLQGYGTDIVWTNPR